MAVVHSVHGPQLPLQVPHEAHDARAHGLPVSQLLPADEPVVLPHTDSEDHRSTKERLENCWCMT